MNNTRRLVLAFALDIIVEARAILESVLADEQDAYDNMPESLQMNVCGEEMEGYITDIEHYIESIDPEVLRYIFD